MGFILGILGWVENPAGGSTFGFKTRKAQPEVFWRKRPGLQQSITSMFFWLSGFKYIATFSGHNASTIINNGVPVLWDTGYFSSVGNHPARNARAHFPSGSLNLILKKKHRRGCENRKHAIDFWIGKRLLAVRDDNKYHMSNIGRSIHWILHT